MRGEKKFQAGLSWYCLPRNSRQSIVAAQTRGGKGPPMSALGQKQTCAPQKVMSALLPKADMCIALAYVCFGPQADSTSSIRSLLGAQRWRSMASEHRKSSKRASPSDHPSLDYGQSEQQDHPERTGISM